MDTFNPNQMPLTQNMDKKSKGPLVAVIIILVLIVVGGLYFLRQRANQEVFIPVESGDSVVESLNQQSSSDELESIEADLNATDLENLDQGAAAIEAELR